LEDNLVDHEMLAAVVAGGGLACELVRCDSRVDFEALLTATTFDLILSDYTLPSFDGLAALEMARQVQPDTPFIFISGTIGEARALAGRKRGAVDHVLKGQLHRLVPTMQRALREAAVRRERKLKEALLGQAQKMAAVSRFAGGLAQHFHHTLAVIRGNLELVLLVHAQLDPHVRECLGNVVAASERAANLIRQLMALGLMQVIQRAPLKLNEVIANLLEVLRRVSGPEVHIECNFDPQLPYVAADVSLLEQVFLNLVLNARDAMPHGGHLVLTAERARVDVARAGELPGPTAGDYVCCTIRDNGTGIRPEHLPFLFEPFFTTKEIGKGHGLGLAVVYAIVQQHGGWVEVDNRVGAGSAFKIFLPIVAPPATIPSAELPERETRAGSERILLIEDDPSVSLITRRILEGHGYEVVAESLAREVLSGASVCTGVDLLLANMILPSGVSGTELAEKLRKANPNLKAIFVSGYGAAILGSDTNLIRQMRGSFLKKPYSPRQLVEAVRRCLDGAKSDPEKSAGILPRPREVQACLMPTNS
jgi:signal transduction histidine kinase